MNLQRNLPLTTISSTVIIGNGLTGYLTALYLAHAGLKVTIIGKKSTIIDERTTALMWPALQILAKIGLEEEISSLGAPLETLYLIDEASPILISTPAHFKAEELNLPYFGLNLPNKHLCNLLEKAIERHPNITYILSNVEKIKEHGAGYCLTLEEGAKLAAQYLIAADGANSLCRSYAKIQTREKKLNQVACVFCFKHTQSHNNMSIEFQTPEGPFTQVPLPGQQSSLVWVMQPEKAQQLALQTIEEITSQLDEKLSQYLGKTTITTPLQTWSLKAISVETLTANNIFLVGEAAHTFPPLGAQGLNLTIRDIVALAKALQLPNDQAKRDSYNNERQRDIKSRTNFVLGLNYSLLTGFFPVKLLRSTAFNLLNHSPFARKFLAHELLTPAGGLKYLKDLWRHYF